MSSIVEYLWSLVTAQYKEIEGLKKIKKIKTDRQDLI